MHPIAFLIATPMTGAEDGVPLTIDLSWHQTKPLRYQIAHLVETVGLAT